MRTARVVLLAVGVVAVAGLAKKWFAPGGVYVPEGPRAMAQTKTRGHRAENLAPAEADR